MNEPERRAPEEDGEPDDRRNDEQAPQLAQQSHQRQRQQKRRRGENEEGEGGKQKDDLSSKYECGRKLDLSLGESERSMPTENGAYTVMEKKEESPYESERRILLESMSESLATIVNQMEQVNNNLSGISSGCREVEEVANVWRDAFSPSPNLGRDDKNGKQGGTS